MKAAIKRGVVIEEKAHNNQAEKETETKRKK